jgi:A/G-specific adenine glycosylase
MTGASFSQRLIEWYLQNHRPLPWRDTTDPYKIWLSEIILQQTRVAQGLPFYLQLVEAFPTVEALAAAPLSRVFRLWQGLGYYSRARNMHACAQAVVARFNGQFPPTFEELLRLPGIGPYTAAAIASLAFRQPVAVVDGNVFRVLARVFGFYQNTATAAGKKIFFAQANALIDRQRPDLFNQAMMEFGALHCTPRAPKCESCIFAQTCFARKHNLQQALPAKAKKQKPRTRYLNYFVFERKNRLLMRARSEGGIWRGLHEFYLVECKPKDAAAWLRGAAIMPRGVRVPAKPVYTCRHALTHQSLHIAFYHIQTTQSWRRLPPGFKWYSRRQAEAAAKPVAITRFLEAVGWL